VRAAAALLVAVLAAAGAAAAGEAHGDPAMTKLPPATVTVTEERVGERLALLVGDVLAVELDSASGGGYLWSVTRADPAVLETLGAETIPPPAETRAVGAPARQRFLFRAVAPGSAGLELALARPWEGGEPRRRFALRLEVAAAPADPR